MARFATTTTAVVLGLAGQTHAQFDGLALLRALSPSPFDGPSYDYDGFEIRYGRFVFRPALFVPEAIIVGFLVLYVAYYFYGSWYNSRNANAWYNAHLPLLETQFSRPGLPNTVISDGASDMFQHATGRRNVVSLHSVFTFLPRHDLPQSILTYGWVLYDLSYQPKDDVTLDFRLPTNLQTTQGFVWALVTKDELRAIKSSRWDLTLTKTQEHNNAIPKELVVMSEIADVTETLLKSHAFAPILEALKDPKVLRHFRSLIISDQPHVRPADGPIRPEIRQRHVYLSLSVPSPSQAADTVSLVKPIFGLIDLIESSRFNLRPETVRKLRTIREELDKELAKELTEEKDQEKEEGKRAAKRKAEEERVAKLSAEQQRKLLEKEKKKSLRKTVNKVKMG